MADTEIVFDACYGSFSFLKSDDAGYFYLNIRSSHADGNGYRNALGCLNSGIGILRNYISLRHFIRTCFLGNYGKSAEFESKLCFTYGLSGNVGHFYRIGSGTYKKIYIGSR